MSDTAAPGSSIRKRLLAFLITSHLLVVSAAAIATYIVASNAANNAYDRSLLDPALNIAENLAIDESGTYVALPNKALQVLTYDQLDSVIYQIRSSTNLVLEGVPELPAAPALAAGE